MAKFSFSRVPKISAHRSSFDLSRKVSMTMNVGTLYPVGKPYEVYPGDTFKIRTKFVCRASSAFLKPVMDNLSIEIYQFFVPHRIVYQSFMTGGTAPTPSGWPIWSFEGVMGENKVSAWAPSVEVQIPEFTSFNVASGSVADYLEFPLGSVPRHLQRLPFRGFAAIYDTWYRDQNNVDPMFIYKGYAKWDSGSILNEVNPNSNPWAQNNYTGMLPKVTKSPDYFTRSLPGPQKGDAVDFLAGGSILPVSAQNDADNLTGAMAIYNKLGVATGQYIGYSSADVVGVTEGNAAQLSLGADLSAAGLSINDFRIAMALQRMLEVDAISGTRYKEMLSGHFGVISPDGRIDEPELLGGLVQHLNIQQVPQTTGAGTASADTLGALGAYSWTDGEGYVTKGFTEHGYLFTCACIKQSRHSYCQGVPKQYTRISRTDFYDPLFSNLGMLPVYKEQIYADGITEPKQTVFGYQDAWAELKSDYNTVLGQMRPNATNSFAIWNFADNYANAPTLNQNFVEETPDYVDRTLAVPSSTADQFIVDVGFNTIAYREMPVYANPAKVGGLTF